MEVSLAVLAATSTTSIVFFPVTFFAGVSKYIFTDLALGVVLSIFASYIFAMTVVPLYCAKFIRIAHEEVHDGHRKRPSFFRRFEIRFNQPSIVCSIITRCRSRAPSSGPGSDGAGHCRWRGRRCSWESSHFSADRISPAPIRANS